MQDKSSLGTRFTCYDCSKKFYDLNKPEPICPGCGANQFEDPTPDPRVAVMERYKGSRMSAKDAAPSKAAFSVEETENAETATTDGDEEEDALSATLPEEEDEEQSEKPPGE